MTRFTVESMFDAGATPLQIMKEFGYSDVREVTAALRASGRSSRKRKLAEQAIRDAAILKDRAAGMLRKDLAEKYRVTEVTVDRVLGRDKRKNHLVRSFRRTAGYADKVPGRYGNNRGHSCYVVTGSEGAVEYLHWNLEYPEVSKLGWDGYSLADALCIHVNVKTEGIACRYCADLCDSHVFGLAAQSWHNILVHHGSDVLFERLEQKYREYFLGEAAPDMSYDPHGRSLD